MTSGPTIWDDPALEPTFKFKMMGPCLNLQIPLRESDRRQLRAAQQSAGHRLGRHDRPEPCRWFTSIQILTLKIPSGLSTDLRPGTEVVIDGAVAGSVQTAIPDPSEPGATIASLAIPKNFMAAIHRDSKVEIRRSLGGVGDPFVKISGGSGPPMPPGGSIEMIAANIKPSPTEMAQVAIGDIRDAAVQSMHNIDKAVNSIDRAHRTSAGLSMTTTTKTAARSRPSAMPIPSSPRSTRERA